MITLGAMTHRFLLLSGLAPERMAALFEIVMNAGGASETRKAGNVRAVARAALMELEDRVEGEIFNDGWDFHVTHRISEGLVLTRDELVLHGPYAHIVPEGVMAGAAGRPVTRIVEHPKLEGLIVKRCHRLEDDATVIEFVAETVHLPSSGRREIIHAATGALIRYQGSSVRCGDTGSILMAFCMIMAVTFLMISEASLAGLIMGLCTVLIALAIILDALLPGHGDMGVHHARKKHAITKDESATKMERILRQNR